MDLQHSDLRAKLANLSIRLSNFYKIKFFMKYVGAFVVYKKILDSQYLQHIEEKHTNNNEKYFYRHLNVEVKSNSIHKKT